MWRKIGVLRGMVNIFVVVDNIGLVGDSSLVYFQLLNRLEFEKKPLT